MTAGVLVALATGAALAAVHGAADVPLLPVEAGAAAPTPEGNHRMSRRRRRERARAVHEEVPQLLDLLAAGSTAGLSAEASFRQAADSLRGPLGRDLAALLRRVDLGEPWRASLVSYVETSGDPDLVRTVAVLSRSEQLGTSLRDATRELAATVREAHRADTLERARTAPVKMLFPLVFLILPAFLLLTVVPVLITTVRTI